MSPASSKRTTPTELVYLTDVPLFVGLDVEDSKPVADAAVRKKLPANSFLCVEGMEANAFAILTRGKAMATLSSEEGRELLLEFLLPGDTVGELSISNIVYYHFNVITLEPAEFLLVNRNVVIELVDRNIDVRRRLASITAQRMLRLQARLKSFALDTAEKRILFFFENVASRLGHRSSTGLEIAAALSHQTIADGCGLSRETVSRLLHTLRECGTLTRTDTGWLVKSSR